ncbi:MULTISPECIES: hypothetical protein [unclassified Shinella]|uniref:hypothetical protein n=1 Tax=unclassified Shinella TaxID=2643062 RepID=UPI00234E735A|nr:MULTISPECIES: hypothetical protein [unclassified Shinella]MCO5153358.1 hypothetical protein [Shinella sp.]MDC7260537.1 hypothetical protein [Shinella sp. HY16]MDC7267432.1 hypothetical protein [Shinella sp. YZ44]
MTPKIPSFPGTVTESHPDIAEAIGAIVERWNRIDHMLYYLFSRIARCGNDFAFDIYHDSASLPGKCNLMKKLLLRYPDHREKIDLKKLLENVQKLYADRNILLHGMYLGAPSNPVVVSPRNTSMEKKLRPEIERHLSALHETWVGLARFSVDGQIEGIESSPFFTDCDDRMRIKDRQRP